MSPNFKSLMKINQLIYPIRLGKTEKERRIPHTVSVDVHLGFMDAVGAERSDRIEDTICYGKVAKQLMGLFGEREYHMVEHVSHTIYQTLRESLPKSVSLRVSTHKLRPPVNCLQGGVEYVCGDWV